MSAHEELFQPITHSECSRGPVHLSFQVGKQDTALSARFLARHPGGINIPASVSPFSTDAACTPVWHSWPPGYCAPGLLVRHTHRRDAASADREPALQVLIPARESVTGCAKPLFTCKLGARSSPLFSLCLKCPHTKSPFTRNTPVVSSSHTVRGAQRARTLGTACAHTPCPRVSWDWPNLPKHHPVLSELNRCLSLCGQFSKLLGDSMPRMHPLQPKGLWF